MGHSLKDFKGLTQKKIWYAIRTSVLCWCDHDFLNLEVACFAVIWQEIKKAVIGWTLVVSQAKIRNDGCMPGVVHMKEICKLNHWREIISFIHELGLQIRSSSVPLWLNSESFLVFHSNSPLRGIVVTGWLPS